MEQTHKKYNKIFALFVLFTTMVTYLSTVAPTVAFWDCGEYIGASHSLAIPHPPGNPLYVMIGRVFSITFFFFSQVAYRINLISVFAASLTAMFIYLIIVRTMTSWMGIPDTRWERIIIYLSGIVGAFFCAFGYTFWFSSVEASVYIPSMFVVVLCTWLAIVWSQSKDPDRDRILILFAYVAFLGIAIHMMSMLALVPVFLYVLISDESKLKDWRLLLTCLLMGTVIYQVSWFFLLGPLTVLVTFIISFMGSKIEKKKWRFCFWIAFFALMGYSVHFYIPIRSTASPIIDENHPVVRIDESGRINWDAFRYFLERKQYGSESMIVRMFWPLAKRTTQFGFDGHMGYGGFHLTQFFHFGRSIGIDRNNTVFQNWGSGGFIRLLLYLIPTILMIYGWYYLYSRSRNMAILLIFLFIIGSIILVFYMNFADGTRPMKRDYQMWVKSGKQGDMPLQHREVRIRDYFFTSGFMFLGMWIGIAFGCILHSLFTNKNQFIRTQLAPMMAVLFAVSPALPFSQNVEENNRRKDWVPYDYAYNLLMSCEKDGILFTNGDNDTFPLWFLQEAEGVRRDVRIVNLSLLNTKWYIKQLKNLEPKVPISFTNKIIESDRLNHQRNPIEKTGPYKMPRAEIVIQLPGRDTKPALRVQDQMVVNIVDSNKWKKPIYFAVTVSSDNLMGLQPYLQMQGLVYRVLREKVTGLNTTDLDRSLFLLNKVYQFRGLGDGSVPISETSLKLVSNYAASFIQAVISMQQSLEYIKKEISALETPSLGDSANATDILEEAKKRDLAEKKRELAEKTEAFKPVMFEKLDQCICLMPWNWRVRLLQQNVLMEYGESDLALEKIKLAQKIEPGKKEYLQQEARLHYLKNDKTKANELLMKLADSESDPWQAYAAICQNYEEAGLYDSAVNIIEKFQLMYPGDTRAANMLKRLEMMKKFSTKKNLDSVKSDSSKKTEIKD